MIELIFAIVIMGVVFITLPLVLLRNASSVEDNLIQESIFLSAAKLSQVLSFQWDQSSSQTGNLTLETADVVTVNAGDPLLDRNATEFRRGHFQQSKHRKMTPQGLLERNATAIGLEGVLYDDIDDFDGLVNFNLIAGTSADGYKKQYRADVNVSYINDGNFVGANTYASNPLNFIFGITPMAAGATSNIKMVTVSIDQNNSTGWQQTLLLRAYVANIGETDYFKRRY